MERDLARRFFHAAAPGLSPDKRKNAARYDIGRRSFSSAIPASLMLEHDTGHLTIGGPEDALGKLR